MRLFHGVADNNLTFFHLHLANDDFPQLGQAGNVRTAAGIALHIAEPNLAQAIGKSDLTR